MRERDCLKAGQIVDVERCIGNEKETESCGYDACPGDILTMRPKLIDTSGERSVKLDP